MINSREVVLTEYSAITFMLKMFKLLIASMKISIMLELMTMTNPMALCKLMSPSFAMKSKNQNP